MRSFVSIVAIVIAVATGFRAAPAAPTAKQALQLKPVQADVRYDIPDADAARQCTVRSIKTKKLRGWEVLDANGTVLRRFLDTNADNKIDQWCYYRSSIEVYRDIDSDYNLKADQYRWLGTAGTRWGIDRDEDGTVDSWRRISAQEVSAEVVAALANGDLQRLQRVLLTEDDLRDIGVGGSRKKEMVEKIDATVKRVRDALRQGSVLPPGATWTHFAAQQPGVVPSDQGDITRDLVVYENSVAIYRSGKTQKELPLGTLIETRHGWRLLELPVIPDASSNETVAMATGGYFFQASLSRPARTPTDTSARLSPKLQKALADLEKIDEQLSRSTELARQAELHRERAKLIRDVMHETDDRSEKATWIRQLADTLGAAAATGKYPEATRQLTDLVGEAKSDRYDDDVIAFITFRELSARYSKALQDPKADYAKIQKEWLKDLESFVDHFPKAEDAAEAMMQLAVTTEFNGEEEKALQWFRRIVKDFPDTGQGEKAAGAIRRIQSVGKRIDIRGKTIGGKTFTLSELRGKTVAVLYFATWGGDAETIVEHINRLAKQYRRQGFRVVGISLDQERSATEAFVRRLDVTWPVLYESGGLDSRLATELGILTVPNLLLVDQDGKMVEHSLHSTQLESELKKVLAK